MKKFISLALFGLLLGGTVGCSNVNSISEDSVDVIRPVIAIRKLASGLDSNNHSFVKFNYTISPSNASDKSIILNLSWVNQNVQDIISNYLTVSSDESDSSITVTCLQNFTNQANLNVTSASNRECYVDIPLDYETKLIGFDFVQAGLAETSNNPWWDGMATGLIYYDSPESFTVYSHEYAEMDNADMDNYFFNFPFNAYASAAAKYSLGTVDSVHETLTVTKSLQSNSDLLFSYRNSPVSYDSIKDVILPFLDGEVRYHLINSNPCYVGAGNFRNLCIGFASDVLTEALSEQELHDLSSLNLEYDFDINVTFSSSNGVSETRTFSFEIDIDSDFFSIPVSSLSVDSDSHTF